MWEKNWSEGLAKEAVWLSGTVNSYAEAALVLQRIGHQFMSASSIWRRVEKWGTQFKEREQAQQVTDMALPHRSQPMRGQQKSTGRKGVAMDGAMVHLQEEGWKELKIGCVFDIESQATFDAIDGEWMEVGHAVNNSYVAHLGGPQIFGELVWAEARRRDWERVYDTQSIGDGARWIWNLTGEHFFDSYQTVDWYHALEHLHTAAQHYHPHNEKACQRWYTRNETLLFQGHAETIARELKQQADRQPSRAQTLRTEAHYFESNQRRMQYLEFREEGYLIGSGMVESGAKQFKSRFSGAGMRWSRPGIERLIPIRSAILSGQFDDLWGEAYQNSPQN